MVSTKVFSLGGSLIVPEGIDIKYLNKFRELILNYIEKGNRAIIVCGGGKTCREYNEAAKNLAHPSNYDLDKMGIATTKVNAELVKILFKDYSHEEIVEDPTARIETDKKIVVASGYKPGNSSDKVAVMLAEAFNASEVINMTNIDMVYDDDPKKNPEARPFEEIDFEKFLKIIGNEWEPGKNVPFDPVATKLAIENNTEIVIINGNNLKNLNYFLEGKSFMGTVIRAVSQ